MDWSRLAAAGTAVLILAGCGGQPAATTACPPGSASCAQPSASGAAATTTLPTPSATLAPAATPTPVPTLEVPYDASRLDLLARLNQWRIDQGLWPFKPNPTLDQMALAQATYIASLPALPDNFHVDATGKGMFERAAALGWPSYSSPAQIAVGEVAYVGANAAAAINFWQHSPIHNKTVTNLGYREIGIGIVPHLFGHVYIAVVGSRPNVLTALVNPASQQLYLSSERYRWSAGGDWIHDATELQILDAQPGTLDPAAWSPWQATLVAPARQTFYVALSDGAASVVVEVNPFRDIAWLPSAMASGGQTALATPTPTPTPLPDAALVLITDALSLSLRNISGQQADLSSLVIGEGETALPLTRWSTYFQDDPLLLSHFPPGQCLQVTAWGIAYPGAPAECKIVRGVINVAPKALFWRQPFAVFRDGQQIAACPGGEGRCEVALP